MLSGASSQARGPGPGSPRQDGHGSLMEPRAQAPRKGACREDPGSHRLSPSPGGSPADQPSLPSWAAWPGQEETRAPPGLPSAPEPPCMGGKPATGPLARLNRHREARLPFSRFLDEVTMQVLDPKTLEAFWGPRGRNPEPSPGERGPGLAQEPLTEAAAPGKSLALSPPLSSEAAAEAAGRLGSSRAVETSGPHVGSGERGGQAASPWQPPSRASAADMEKLRLRSPWVPSCLAQSRVLQGRLARSSPSLWDSAMQEQKGELRKRLSYTTHKLEKLENEFDSTRHYLEIELRRAQEELEKVTEKLRRIQTNYMTLQRINQELEEKLQRMGQHYEEEKRALSHEIVALNSHLLEAKVTIDKLSEDNELYRKDCNLAAQLLQCSQNYGRVHKVSELPLDFQERVSLHLEKHGRSLPPALRRPAYADCVPACVIAKVLEKPEPSGLSSPASEASRDLSFRGGAETPGLRPPYKDDAYSSDTALYCPEEPRRERERRPSADAPVGEVGFLRAQSSADSAAEEEAGAAAYPAAYEREPFAGYAASLPTSSSYSSFSATSEEREHGQAGTLTAAQRAVYLDGREPLFPRAPGPAGYPGGARLPRPALEAEAAPGFARTLSPYQADSYGFPGSPGVHRTLMTPPNLWSLRAKPGSARMPRQDLRGPWRPVEEIGAYSFPVPGRRPSPRRFPDRYYGGSSPGHRSEGRDSPFYASYKADSFSEGDDFSQGHLAEPPFLRARGPAYPMPGYASSEGDGERLPGQLCGVASPEPEQSLQSSRDSLEPSSMEGSPEMHPEARLSPQPTFPRGGGTGLNRKDSLTKAQLYGTLLN